MFATTRWLLRSWWLAALLTCAIVATGLAGPAPSAAAAPLFVTWVLDRFPPPDDVTVQLFEWGDHPRVTAGTTVQDLLAAGP